MNLLPEEEKNNLKREYLYRFYALAVYFLAFAFVLGAAAIFPHYVSSREDLLRINKEIEYFGEEDVSVEEREAMAEFTEFNKRLALLDPSGGPATPRPSDIFIGVLQERPASVHVTSFSYLARRMEKSGEKPGRVVVTGTAGDRDSLHEFTQNLAAREGFAEVNLPVSNFSKKTDIDFSITITLAGLEDDAKN